MKVCRLGAPKCCLTDNRGHTSFPSLPFPVFILGTLTSDICRKSTNGEQRRRIIIESMQAVATLHRLTPAFDVSDYLRLRLGLRPVAINTCQYMVCERTSYNCPHCGSLRSRGTRGTASAMLPHQRAVVFNPCVAQSATIAKTG